jgi:osomolarity two-component system phosphorelay intermediate protein YPD1
VLAEMQQRSDLFDYGTISQILEMDDEGAHDFSKEVFADFCDQFQRTFERLNKARCVSLTITLRS